MRNSVLQYTNDIYLHKVKRPTAAEGVGTAFGGYANPERRENAEGTHAYVVEWQIPEEPKNMNYATV